MEEYPDFTVSVGEIEDLGLETGRRVGNSRRQGCRNGRDSPPQEGWPGYTITSCKSEIRVLA